MNDKQMINPPLAAEKSVDQAQPKRRITPLVDIYETADELVLLADLPGVETPGLQLEIEQKVLTLEANLSDQQGVTETSFYRQFTLSEQIDLDAGEALLKDGVLTLTLPKVAAAKPRRITVKTVH